MKNHHHFGVSLTMVVSIIILLCSGYDRISIHAQQQAETIQQKYCSVHPLDSSRNILELSGTFNTTRFQIMPPISNCFLYFHDLNCSGITISAPVSFTSNISIERVASTNPTIATFISIDQAITNFGFIKLDSVRHNSLLIDSASGSEVISVICFKDAVSGWSGKSGTAASSSSSIISISNIEMNDVVCNRSSSGICSSAIVYFKSTITNITCVNITNLSNQRVSMISPSALAFGVAFVGQVANVTEIIFQRFTFNLFSIDTRSSGTPATFECIYFTSGISGTTNSLVVNDATIQNVTVQGATARVLLFTVSAAAQISSRLQLSGITLRNVTTRGSGAGGSAIVQLARFSGEVTGGLANSSSSSTSIAYLIFENATVQNLEIIGVGSSYLYGLAFDRTVTNYQVVVIRNIHASKIEVRSAASYSSLYLFYFSKSLSLLQQQSSSLLNIENISLNDVSVLSVISNSELRGFQFSGAVSGYNSIAWRNINFTKVTTSSTNDHAYAFLFYFSQSISAPTPSSSSSPITLLAGENITVDRVVASGYKETDIQVVYIASSVTNFVTILFSTIAVKNYRCSAAAASFISKVSVVYFESTVTAPTTVATTSLVAENIELVNGNSENAEADLTMSLFHLGGTASNYNTMKFSNITAANLLMQSGASASIQAELIYANGLAAKSTSPTSILIIEKVILQNVSCVSLDHGGSQQLLFISLGGSTLNYVAVQISSVTASDLYVKSDSLAVQFVKLDAPSISTSNPAVRTSLFFVENIQIQNVTSVAVSDVTVDIFGITGAIRSYNNLTLANVIVSRIAVYSSNATSTIRLLQFGGSTTASITSSFASLEVQNITLLNATCFSALSTAQMLVLNFDGGVSNRQLVRLCAMLAENLIVSSFGPSSSGLVSIVNFGLNVVAPSTCTNCTFALNNVVLTNVKVLGRDEAETSMSLFSVGTFSNYATILFTNICLSNLICNSTKSAASAFFFVLNRDVSAPSLSSSASSSSSFAQSSQVLIDNISAKSVAISSDEDQAGFTLLLAQRTVNGFGIIRTSRVTIEDLLMNAPRGMASFHAAIFASTIHHSIASSSSSLQFEDVALQNAVVSGGLGGVQVRLIVFTAAPVNYSQVIFSGIMLDGLRANSAWSSSSVCLACFQSSISAPDNGNDSILQAKNLTLRNVAVASAGESFVSAIAFREGSFRVGGFTILEVSDSLLDGCVVELTVATQGAMNRAVALLAWLPSVVNCSRILIKNNKMINVSSISWYQNSTVILSLFAVESGDGIQNAELVEFSNNIIIFRDDNNMFPSWPDGNKMFFFNSSYFLVDAVVFQDNVLELKLTNNSSKNRNEHFISSLAFISLWNSAMPNSLTIANCTLRVASLNQEVTLPQNVCSAEHCSLLHITLMNNNFLRYANNNGTVLITLTGNSITSPSRNTSTFSMISFEENYLNNTNETIPPISSSFITAIIVVNNFLKFASQRNQVLAFRSKNSSTTSESLTNANNNFYIPPFISVEVGCNRWSNEVNRQLVKYLLMNAIFDNYYSNSLDSFLRQTCLSHSNSRTRTSSTAKTASQSNMKTNSTILSSSASSEKTRTLSLSSISVSKSSQATESTSVSFSSNSATTADSLSESQRTQTKSHQVSQTNQKEQHTDGSSSSSPTFTKTNTQIIPKQNSRFTASSQIQSQVYSAALTSANLLTVLSSVVSAAASSSSSSSVNGFGAVRARVVLRSFNDILSGNCGIEDAVTAFDEQPPDLSSSPTQLSISSPSSSSLSGRGYGYVTGLVVGNFLLIFAFGLVWFTIFVMISCFKHSRQMSISKKSGFAFPDNPRNLYERFIASKSHDGMFVVSCILLPPTLTCSAAALIAVFLLPDKQQYHHAAIPAISVVLGWGFILILGFVVPMRKLLLQRNTIGDAFVLAEGTEDSLEQEQKKQS